MELKMIKETTKPNETIYTITLNKKALSELVTDLLKHHTANKKVKVIVTSF